MNILDTIGAEAHEMLVKPVARGIDAFARNAASMNKRPQEVRGWRHEAPVFPELIPEKA